MEGKVTRKSQGKPCLTKLVAFSAMGNRKAVDIIYVDHGKVFDVVFLQPNWYGYTWTCTSLTLTYRLDFLAVPQPCPGTMAMLSSPMDLGLPVTVPGLAGSYGTVPG
ncbi:hypothetical protein GRJ2_000351800 [Grus japonensis]|uniref:Uncharacterized protein n=1 Tax=Grus japonensis TaxID=30415 RepID=A0ABC9W029_GRUJA